MSLLRRVHNHQKDRDRFEAALHGRELVDDATTAAVPLVGGGGLRSFHERMKKRLGID